MNKKLFLIFGIIAFAFFVGAYKINAALEGEGLTISPPIVEQEISPGETKVNTIRISNPTASLVEAYPRAMDFAAKGETGEPAFSEGQGDVNSYALSSWISFSEPKIAMAPEQVKEFKYTITVPANAEPGGHYGAVFFATEPPKSDESSSQVSLSTMIGSLVLVKVPGNITERAEVLEFKAAKNIYFSAKSVDIDTRVSNTGNVHVKPLGEIKLTNIFGQSPATLEFNSQRGNVLPESVRKFQNNWHGSILTVGPIKATLNAAYGEAGDLTAVTSFWVIPWWIIVIFAVVLVFIIFFSFKNKKGRTKKAKSVSSANEPKVLIR